MAKKNITIDDLATMVQKGFDETSKKDEVNKRFDIVESRLDKIEKLVLENHRKRLEKLEAEIKDLKELFAM